MTEEEIMKRSLEIQEEMLDLAKSSHKLLRELKVRVEEKLNDL